MNDLLPTRFQLTMNPQPETGGFVARNQDAQVHYAMLFRSWKANPDGTLDLSWGTGFAGYGVRFTGLSAVILTTHSTTELRGTAYFWTDTDQYPPNSQNDHKSVQAVAHRAACQEKAK